MSSGTPGGNWRNAGGNRPASSSSTSRRSWQPGSSTNKPVIGKRRSRLGRFLFAGLLTGVILALIVVVIYYWQPAKYPTLVVVGPAGGSSLSTIDNSAGVNAASRLADWAKEGDSRPKLAAPAADTADKNAWQGKLDGDAKSLVLYFSAPGGADATGPFLWFIPEGVRTPTADHKIYIRDILTRLEGLPKGKSKLLIFDAARLRASDPHGMLFNDFARALKELDAKIDSIEGLVVICSSDEDQRAWDSEEWRSSVFGHFFLEGLKGAGGKQAGERITAAELFDYSSAETAKWALANRDEKQTPILLPLGKGRERAAKLELASVPSSGFTAASRPEVPAKMPADLEAAWGTAFQLSQRVPAPDTLDPLKWREYLDLVLRWERLVRFGENPEGVRAKAQLLAGQLELTHGAADPPCLPVAFPAGRALGVPLIKSDLAAFNKLWASPAGAARGDEWLKQLGPTRANETARRIAVAEMVVERVVNDGPTSETLATADDVLGTVDGPRVGTAEAHFIRILHRRLDPHPESRPGVDVLIEAIKLRREAEETAWVFGADTNQYPHGESLFRWVGRTVLSGDAARRSGEDLLFDGNADSWKKAAEVYFPEARTQYKQARDQARIITAAFTARDKVLARLPYYARWLAAYRGPIPPSEVERLLGKCESAARGAHTLHGFFLEDRADEAILGQLGNIDKLTKSVNADFDEVVKAFDAEVGSFANTVHPSNWHALDNALRVPFIPARERAKLLGYVRDISFQLATKSEQPGGAAAPDFPARDFAQRQGRVSLALFGDDAPDRLRALVLTPNPDAWWKSLREAGDLVGGKYQNLALEIRTETTNASAKPEYLDGGAGLQKAAYLARLVDPAAALPIGEDPPAAERRFRQHAFLLWHARRTVNDGWANLNSTAAAPSWYCMDAAKLCLDTARPLALGTEPNLPPLEIERRLKSLNQVQALGPVILDLQGPEESTITDAPVWNVDFTLSRAAKDVVGFPVFWVTPPGPELLKADPTHLGRKSEPRLSTQESVTHRLQFAAVPQKADSGASGQFTTRVLYRGHIYERTTELRPTGSPSRTLVYSPPKGDAAFYVIADRKDVAGAVTILIDRSDSMKLTPAGATESKYTQVCEALREILDDLPENTELTIAGFYGENRIVHVAPANGQMPITWKGGVEQKKRVMAAVESMTPIDNGITPIGLSIERILSKEGGAAFWPRNASGVRTLIVLTDGEDISTAAKPGHVALNALLDTSEDTSLHLVLFALNADQQTKAIDQFDVTTHLPTFRERGRTPAVIYPNVKNAAGIAEKIREAMRPRVKYCREETANDSRAWRNLIVTLPGEPTRRPSIGVPAGDYYLRGLRDPQKLRLEPGDRVILTSVASGNKFNLTVPSFAYDLAGDPNTGWPRAQSNAVRMTLETTRLRAPGGFTDLDAVVTLESNSTQAGEYLRLPRPAFAWFDVTGPDGKPGDPELRTALRIENRTGLVAPAWNLQLTRWDRSVAQDRIRRPTVTGFWIEGFPAPAYKYSFDLRALPTKTTRILVDGLPVDVAPPTIEHAGGPGLEEGDYLTLRASYSDPTRPILIRPGKLKGVNQRFDLCEQHLYFDASGRYTARFGPITELDKKIGTVEADFFSVSDLRERARGRDNEPVRAVSVSYPGTRPLKTGNLSALLEFEPEK